MQSTTPTSTNNSNLRIIVNRVESSYRAGPGYRAGPDYRAGPGYRAGPSYHTGPGYRAGPDYRAGPTNRIDNEKINLNQLRQSVETNIKPKQNTIILSFVEQVKKEEYCVMCVTYPMFAFVKKPANFSCSSPKNCGYRHCDVRPLKGICGEHLVTGKCTTKNCPRAHVKEINAHDSVTIPEPIPEPTRVTIPEPTRVTIPEPTPEPTRVSTNVSSNVPKRFMCQYNLEFKLGVSNKKCSHNVCSFAHSEKEQDIPSHIKSFVTENSIINEDTMIEVIKVLKESKFNEEIVKYLSYGSWPAMTSQNVSVWLNLWNYAQFKYRKIEPNALALFGKVNGPKEKMVLEVCRRLNYCPSSAAMKQQEIFGISNQPLVNRLKKINNDDIFVCQGGANCNKGAHHFDSFDANQNAIYALIDKNNLNGNSSNWESHEYLKLKRKSIYDQHSLLKNRLTELQNMLKKNNKRYVSGNIRKDGKELLQIIKDNMANLRDEYTNNYPLYQILPVDTKICIKDPHKLQNSLQSFDSCKFLLSEEFPDLSFKQNTIKICSSILSSSDNAWSKPLQIYNICNVCEVPPAVTVQVSEVPQMVTVSEVPQMVPVSEVPQMVPVSEVVSVVSKISINKDSDEYTLVSKGNTKAISPFKARSLMYKPDVLKALRDALSQSPTFDELEKTKKSKKENRITKNAIKKANAQKVKEKVLKMKETNKVIKETNKVIKNSNKNDTKLVWLKNNINKSKEESDSESIYDSDEWDDGRNESKFFQRKN
jgi:hypothetical protein